ncbi:MAG: hydroxysqualene dehydroxylase HpnE [Chloroflexota bacterium]
MTRPTVAIAGGGIAGLATACELADAGYAVTLLEKRPFLGGRAYSYTDASGVTVDNGQHVFLGCCSQYIRFLEHLGVRDAVHLQKRFRVPVVDKVWGESVLLAANLPPPGHLLPSLLRFKSLSPKEKALAGWALSQMQLTDRAKHPELDDITFEEWLLARKQSPRAIRSLWNLIVLPTLNGDISRVSADLAMMVFQEGFLRSRNGANVGWAKVGLTELLAGAAQRYIEARGGEVRIGAGIRGVDVEGGEIARLQTDAGDVTADAYVLALAVESVLGVLPDAVSRDQFFARIGRIETSPIVNVHLWYDRPVWDRGFAAFLNTPVQWVFNKTKLWHESGPGQYLDISLSGADDFVDWPSGELIEHFRKEMLSLLPATRGATLVRALVVKQRDATFAALPGVARLRPTQATPVGNLFLAGDWTQTGWPATMESAVRSGGLAARAVIQAASRGRTNFVKSSAKQ